MNWKQVTEEQFQERVLENAVDSDTVHICEPPVQFFWDHHHHDGDYDKAIGKIVFYYDPKAVVHKVEPTFWVPG